MAAYKPIDRIEVEVWGKSVGAVVLDPSNGYYVFAYYPHFVKFGIELAPIMMPLSFDPYVFPFLPELTYKRLPALLADALPDDFGNSLVDAWMAQKGVSKESITALDRLGYMGKRGMGALEFRPSRTKVTSSRTAIDLSKLVEVARQSVSGDFQTDAMAEAALNQIIQVGTSAGGARAKAAIAWNPDTNEIRAGQFDVAPGFEHWLLKFDGVGTDLALGSSQDYGRIEMAYYLMATTAGISMSPCRLIEENGRAHFMTKRFDRDANKKIHMTTLCGMAHLDYKQKATHDYAQYFMVINRLGLGYQAMEEAFRRMTFNVMAANCDDHTKNHAFIMAESGSWRLAPAYDVTHAYSPASEWTHQHLMSVNGKFRDITREDLLAVANRFGIGTAKRVIREVGEAVSKWMEFARETGVDYNEASKIKSHHIII